MTRRYAIIDTGPRGATRSYTDSFVERVARYLPENYKVLGVERGSGHVIVGGEDVAGWTLSDYVLPRLASGLISGDEVSAEIVGTLDIDVTVDEAVQRG